MIFNSARSVASAVLLPVVIFLAVLSVVSPAGAVDAEPPPPTIEYVGGGDAVCPPGESGWEDTSVSESLQFCFHEDHGAMQAGDAWALHEQGLRTATAGASASAGSGSVGSRVVYDRTTSWNVYPDGDETHWRTVARNYNTWVDRSGCETRDGEKCEKIPVASSDAAMCRQLGIPSGLGYKLAGGYTC